MKYSNCNSPVKVNLLELGLSPLVEIHRGLTEFLRIVCGICGMRTNLDPKKTQLIPKCGFLNLPGEVSHNLVG